MFNIIRVILYLGDYMTKKRIKRKIKKRRLVVSVFIAILIIVFCVFFVIDKMFSTTKVKMYIASDDSTVDIYVMDEEDKLTLYKEVVRGTKIVSLNNEIIYDEVNYTEVEYEGRKYYIVSDKLVSSERDVVLEDIKYVRTSVTVYENEVDSKIASFIKKGNEIEIIGYDKLFDDGTVNMYKVRSDETEGWVYAKYLVSDLDSASSNYNENGVYDIHKDRRYSMELYGGSASTLDYYPYEKVEFEGNPLLKEAKTMYLNANSNVINNIDKYLDIARNNGVNAIVVDIKDGSLAYASDIAKQYSMTAYNTAINSNDVYKSAIDKIKEAGIYAIGRIVVFNDVHYGNDHPEDCISSSASSRLWPSVYSRGAWEYNVELAKEAVTVMGFNEIQFDYVRFPEDAYNMSVKGNTDFKNVYNEEKAEAVQNFLFYAADQIHKVDAYLSVDVFGECSSEYVTSYGQYWPAISNIVDAISSMPYTDHFGRTVDTWTKPYDTVYKWALGASKRQTEIPTPAIARTWITAYDTPYWNPVVRYDANKIIEQVQALYDAGLTGGFITWNSKSSLDKYEQIKSAFSKEYS